MSSFTDFRRPTRASPVDATARRRAALIVGPFLKNFEGWNRRAARTGALILAHVSTETEKARHRDDLVTLRAEVELAYDQFREAVADQPQHGRIDDVRAAFDRMLSVLKRACS